MTFTIVMFSRKAMCLCAIVLVSAGEASGAARGVIDAAPGAQGPNAGGLQGARGENDWGRARGDVSRLVGVRIFVLCFLSLLGSELASC